MLKPFRANLRAYILEATLIGSMLLCCIILVTGELRADNPNGGVALVGTLNSHVGECYGLLNDNGLVVWLSGEIGKFQIGDRVLVRGTANVEGICNSANSLKIESIEAASLTLPFGTGEN